MTGHVDRTVPPEAAREPVQVEVGPGQELDLRIAPVTKSIGDVAVRMLAYNGSVPGPTLRAAQGTSATVHIQNLTDEPTTVHWHGLRIDNRYDGTHLTQHPIPAGERFSAVLDFPDPGLYWYHPHVRSDYGLEMGLAGTILVQPADPDYWPEVHRELVLTLDDVLLADGQVAPFDAHQPTHVAMGRFGDVLLVNGEVQPTLPARQGEVVRLYLVNTANTRVFDVAVPGATMKLVGGDSGRVEREELVDHVVLAPSERVVVDLLLDRPGRLRMEHRTPGQVHALAHLEVSGPPAAPLTVPFDALRTDADLAAERERVAAYRDALPDKTLSFLAEMSLPEDDAAGFVCPMHPEVTSTLPGTCPKCGMKLVSAALVASGEGDGHAGHDTHSGHDGPDTHSDHGAAGAASDGIEWEDDMVEVNRITTPENMRWQLVDQETGAVNTDIDWTFAVGDQVKLRLRNELAGDHPMHHPFHIHGAGRFLVLSRDGRPDPNLVWKDTVLVRTGEVVDILLDVTHPGEWMAHCHIAEHHEAGMMLTFSVTKAASPHSARGWRTPSSRR